MSHGMNSSVYKYIHVYVCKNSIKCSFAPVEDWRDVNRGQKSQKEGQEKEKRSKAYFQIEI